MTKLVHVTEVDTGRMEDNCVKFKRLWILIFNMF